MNKLVELIKTPRRSVVALSEAKVLKDYIKVRGKCINCHEACSAESASPRHNGVCGACGAMYDNMLSVKNRIIRGEQVGLRALNKYLTNLRECRYLPASLRGVGSLEELVGAMAEFVAEEAERVVVATSDNVSSDVLRLLSEDEQ